MTRKNALLWALPLIFLFFFGFFYHISSSEFWPVTISHTWWSAANFEYSQLQKPLFTFLLSLLHLLPLNDVTHLYAAKAIFSLVGVMALYFLAQVAMLLAGKRTQTLALLTALVLVVLSPVYLSNFFRMRSDQLCFLFFVLALYCNLQKRPLLSLFFLLLVPVSAAKGMVFAIPAFFILLPQYTAYLKKIPPVWRLNVIMAIAAVLIWVVNYNFGAIHYFAQTYAQREFPNPYLKQYIISEWPWLIAALIGSLILYKRDPQLRSYALASVSLFLLFLLPQAYPFFIASFAPLLYLPALVLFLRAGNKWRSLILLQAVNLAVVVFYFSIPVSYYSNTDQFFVLRRLSAFIERHNFNYIDGTGLLPRKKFIPCFFSPGDDEANNSCRERFNSPTPPDAIIVTQRLNDLGNIFQIAEANYFQVFPNFWVHKKFREQIKKEEIDLSPSPPPILIFTF